LYFLIKHFLGTTEFMGISSEWGAFHKKIMSDRFSTKTALCTKIREVATILPNMSENYQEIKPWQGLKIFENL